MTAYATVGYGSDDRTNGRRRRRHRCGPWRGIAPHGFEIALMVLGFVLFWPLGLAILFLIFWRRSYGEGGSLPGWMSRNPAFLARDSGNSAFEEWKRSELDRLEAERRRLADAQREFSEFLDRLRRAKDRDEFDRFMMERTGQRPPGDEPSV